jgi:toxin CptA
MTSAPAIGFDYRPSRLFVRVALTTAALALLAVLLCGLAWWIKAVLVVVLVAMAWRVVRVAARMPVRAVGWTGNGGWTLRLTTGEELPATLASHRVIGALLLLRLHAPGLGEVALLLGADNSDADLRRRLRMRLALPSDAGGTSR